MAYYDTTSLAPVELAKAQAITEKQNDLILRLFRNRPGELMTPSQVLTLCQLQGRKFLLTSVRRAMSDLAHEKHLEHTDVKRPGPYGKPETCWRLRQDNA